jgi:hypothetical protein
MSQSAAHYWQACQDDNDDTIAFRFGRGFHALSLGTPVHRWTGKNRNSNDYKEFVAANPGEEVLTTKEWDTAHRMFEAIQRHATARELLFGKGTCSKRRSSGSSAAASARADRTRAAALSCSSTSSRRCARSHASSTRMPCSAAITRSSASTGTRSPIVRRVP